MCKVACYCALCTTHALYSDTFILLPAPCLHCVFNTLLTWWERGAVVRALESYSRLLICLFFFFSLLFPFLPPSFSLYIPSPSFLLSFHQFHFALKLAELRTFTLSYISSPFHSETLWDSLTKSLNFSGWDGICDSPALILQSSGITVCDTVSDSKVLIFKFDCETNPGQGNLTLSVVILVLGIELRLSCLLAKYSISGQYPCPALENEPELCCTALCSAANEDGTKPYFIEMWSLIRVICIKTVLSHSDVTEFLHHKICATLPSLGHVY